MELVATLVSDPAAPAVDGPAIARARDALPATTVDILAPGVAADLAFAEDAAPGAVEARLRDALAGLPVDVFVQRPGARRKRLLLADMDSTLIGQECIDELAAELGIKDRIAAITERAMQGEIAFEPALRGASPPRRSQSRSDYSTYTRTCSFVSTNLPTGSGTPTCNSTP